MKTFEQILVIARKGLKVDIDPDSKFYDSSVYHKSALYEFLQDAEHEIENKEDKDLEDSIKNIKQTVKYLKGVEKIEELINELEPVV